MCTGLVAFRITFWSMWDARLTLGSENHNGSFFGLYCCCLPALNFIAVALDLQFIELNEKEGDSKVNTKRTSEY